MGHVGDLEKRARRWPRSSRRVFEILPPKRLTYINRRGERVEAGDIVTCRLRDERRHHFSIYTSHQRTFHLRASSAEDANAWIVACRAAIMLD
jgi:hypothetical protein